MVEFKAKADAIIKERWGIEVEHICAERRERERETYESMFYRVQIKGQFVGTVKGFPMCISPWCKKLKYEKINIPRYLLQTADKWKTCRTDSRVSDGEWSLVSRSIERERAGQSQEDAKFSESALTQGADKNTVVQYLGIAIDEPKRLARLDGITKISPLAAIGWTEADCRRWCEENNLLSPVYTTAARGGCWFCHNQGIEQLRLLRKTYPDLWSLLLKWDKDSPVSFKPDGRTVHDYDRRFALEDLGEVPSDRTFRWKMIEQKSGVQ